MLVPPLVVAAVALLAPSSIAAQVRHADRAEQPVQERDLAFGEVTGRAHALPLLAHPHARRGGESSSAGLKAKRARRDTLTVAGVVGVGGLELELRHHPREAERSELERRADVNGSIIALGTAQSTFVLPVAFGEPPVAFPLQLDTGSADLLLATTLCGVNCPSTSDTNPYYVAKTYSSTFESVNNNATTWSTSYGDGTVASGFVARERVGIANMTVPGQVFGMINATNITLSQQKISGIMGLGFPRLSTLSRVLLKAEFDEAAADAATTSLVVSSTSSGTIDASSTVLSSDTDASSTVVSSDTATATSASKRSSHIAQRDSSVHYLPPLLESLVSSPDIPYPVFALALSPPLVPTETTTTSGASATSRYGLNVGSLTLGGVSSQYVSDNTTSGRTVNDIEWWPVVPFGSPNTTTEATTTVATVTTTTDDATSTDVSSAAATTSAIDGHGVPTDLAQLESEQYLYWTVELANVAVNGTAVGLNSTYASLGLPSMAVLDVGTNGIYGPQQDVAKIFAKITDARQVSTGQWAVPCDTKMTLGFSFGGRYVQLQPSDWMSYAVAGSSMCLAWPVAVEDSGDGIDWTLGTPFLKNVYSVFSYGINGVQAPLVGFLPLQDGESKDTSAVPTAITAASLTATIQTTFPNQLLTGPNYPTATYAFSTPMPTTGAIQTMGLANASIYAVSAVPVVSLQSANASASSAVPIGWPGGSSDRTASSAVGAVLGINAALLVALLAGASVAVWV